MPHKKDMTERKTTTMRIRKDLFGLLDKEAAKRERSRTWLMEQILAQWLQSQGRKVSTDIML